MISRLVRSVDFERVLRTRSRASSTHFAVHHLTDRPSAFVAPPSRLARGPAPEIESAGTELSTAWLPGGAGLVDDLSRRGLGTTPVGLPVPVALLVPIPMTSAPDGCWLGLVVPKRHARRAVTRSLLKRQIRTVMRAHEDTLPQGLWVVRLRAPFDRQRFVSAASEALLQTTRAELDQLLSRVVRPSAAN